MNKRDRRPRHAPQPPDPGLSGTKSTALPVQIASGTLVSSVPSVSATAAPQRIIDKGTGRRALRFFNEGPDPVLIGGRDVTAANGLPIEPGTGFLEEMAPDAEWYVVTETGDAGTMRLQVIS